MSRNIFLLLALLYCITINAKAAEDRKYVSFLGLRLNAGVTLAQVQKKLGATKLQEKGDAGGYEASICYWTPDRYKVTFFSDELGGPRT